MLYLYYMRIWDICKEKNRKMHLARFNLFNMGKTIDYIAKKEKKHYQTIRKSIFKGMKLYEAQKS